MIPTVIAPAQKMRERCQCVVCVRAERRKRVIRLRRFIAWGELGAGGGVGWEESGTVRVGPPRGQGEGIFGPVFGCRAGCGQGEMCICMADVTLP